VGFDHVFATAQPVRLAPDLTLKVASSTALILLKIVAFMDDPQRRAKDLDDIRGLLVQYEADSDRVSSDVVVDAALEDYGLAPAFLLGLDLRCARTRKSQLSVRSSTRWMKTVRHGCLSFGLEASAIISRKMFAPNSMLSDRVLSSRHDDGKENLRTYRV
jgi:predicted nucleotidyltransferase